ncbi:hypothetical protein THASP1DRAFT_25700 [Thamnocephalis sphaerospora]|uniref:Actin-related protein 5 n=1 Tax=Thamnocephalis sphaerospora TaxID=78915 RepID=A0A4P9XKR9_9FUNG|nr:hypothetical protein THASP1DRAFT_25700 [Thamnocephalis sphaerospora]|eukprot:RKP05880.1 hypothetical protein THASP1DRAFT_25700 [Thamnocephalis sphaerospora]
MTDARMESRPLKIFDIAAETDALQQRLAAGVRASTLSSTAEQPIVIDYAHQTIRHRHIGAYECRAGWAGESDPSVRFPTVLAKYRDRRISPKNLVLVGPDVMAHQQARSSARTPFDGGVVCNSEYMLGLNGSSVDRPLLLTEPVCTPRQSRKLMSELVFECYRAPSVSYGLDAMFSFYQNGHSLDEGGIICSLGHSASHVLPVFSGRGLFNLCKRLSFGGGDAEEFILKLMQAKYPTFPSRMSSLQARVLLQEHTYIADDYWEEERKYESEEGFFQLNHTIQFPYTSAKAAEEKSEEEMAAAAERRRAHLQRLQELAAKSRLEKVPVWREVKRVKPSSCDFRSFMMLEDNSFASLEDLDATVKEIEQAVKRAQNRKAGNEETDEPPRFPLVDIPTDQLNEEEKKEQRKQRLLKASYEARERQRRQKEEEAQKKADKIRKEEEQREADPEAWLESIRARWTVLWDKVEEARKEKEQLGDRRSQASRKRMQVALHLQSGCVAVATAAAYQMHSADDFGRNDEDWYIYHDINKEEDQEDEEEQEELEFLEGFLNEHDAGFLDRHKNQLGWSDKSPLLRRFFWADAGDSTIETAHQLQLNVERVRVPEVLFQPGIMGIDQAGIGEILEDLIKRLDANAQSSMLKTIFVTGGMARLPNLARRLDATLTSLLPVGSPHQVRLAADPLLDAWRGGARWARTNADAFRRASITRAQYEEFGPEYLAESAFSNPYFA